MNKVKLITNQLNNKKKKNQLNADEDSGEKCNMSWVI